MSTLVDAIKYAGPELSPAGLGFEGTLVLIRPEDTDEASVGKYVRLSLAQTGFLITTVIGVVEVVFWTVIALLTKAVHLFIPKPSKYADAILAFTAGRAYVATLATCFSAIFFAYNFFSTKEDLNKNFLQPLIDSSQKGITKMEGYLTYQFFGTVAPNN